MTDTEKALEKLAIEWKECGSIGGNKNVVNRPIYDMLRGFCKADAEFAGLLASTDRTLKQCLEEVHKSAQSGWSDYAVFSRAIAAYVPGAKIIDKPNFGWKHWDREALECVELVGLCTDICVVSNALIIKASFPEIPVRVDSACCAGVTPQTHEAALATMRMCQIEVI